MSIQEEIEPFPSKYVLYQNYPNPFNPTTTIVFSIVKSTRVNLEIYDLLGRHVRTLENKKLPVGYHSIVWNGKNEKGIPVSSGLYIYLLRTNEFVEKKQMILLK